MSDRLPTKEEARVLETADDFGVLDEPMWRAMPAEQRLALLAPGWVWHPLPATRHIVTETGREALASYHKAQTADPADNVTNYDPDLARLVAAAQPFRAWAEMIGGDGKTVLVDKTVWTPTDTQTVKITVQDLHMLMATIDDVLSKGKLK